MEWIWGLNPLQPSPIRSLEEAADGVAGQASDQASDDRDHSCLRDEENNSTESYYQVMETGFTDPRTLQSYLLV